MRSSFLSVFYKEFLKWQASFHICLSRSLTYKMNFLAMMTVPVLVFFLIKYSLWTSIYSVNPVKEIQGYTLSRMIEYQFWIFIFDLFVRSYFFSENISSDIRLGRISSFLLYPFHFIAYQFSSFISDKAIQFFIAVCCFILVISTGLIQEPLISNILKFGFLIFLAALYWFFIQIIIGVSAFWLEETWSLNVAIRFISAFLSGTILPLDFFPKFLADFLLWTPFPYLAYFPAQILMGNEFSFVFCISILFFWIGLFFFISKWIWRKGLNLYTAVGI